MTFVKLILLQCILTITLTSSSQTDIQLLRKINLNRNSNLDNTFLFITNSDSPISIATPLIIYGSGLIKQSDSLKKSGIFIASSIAISTIISTALKYSINRPRPFETYPDIEKLTSGGSPSFPSGHTSLAFSTATSLSLAFPKWYVIAPSMLWASSVGYSRMHLGVHYPSDVLAGVIIGSGSAFLSNWLNKKLFKH